MPHVPVLLNEAVAAFSPWQGQVYVDVTLGAGGHAKALAEKLQSHQTLLGLDRDANALAVAEERLEGVQPQFIAEQLPFSKLKHAVFSHGIRQVDGGILADLGMSNIQLNDPQRGFSFQTKTDLDMRDLDMRMDARQSLTAADVVNTWEESELIRIMKDYADERLARPLAREILAQRPLKSVKELATLAQTVYHSHGNHPKNIHPATRLFQAVRMAVNSEVEEIENFLASLEELTAPGAIIAMITFHSIEDRLVKQFFKRASVTCLCPPQLPICQCGHVATFEIIGKPVTPSEEEITRNPQSRSAKLRIAKRI